MVVGSVARFSAFEIGLANAKRPKVKNAKKKEATRANNIVLEKAGVAEEFEERAWVDEQRLLVDVDLSSSLPSFMPFESAHWLVDHATRRYSPAILAPQFHGVELFVCWDHTDITSAFFLLVPAEAS